jgi:predicted DNA-binding transcriptional regulator AlpA
MDSLPTLAVSPADAAGMLGVNVSTIYKLAKRDPSFPPFRKIGRATRLDLSQLRDWYDKQVRSAASVNGGNARHKVRAG